MKHIIPLLLMAAVLLPVQTGCTAVGVQSSHIAENTEDTEWTVRIVNQSGVNLYGIAISYSANSETLGSKACDRIEAEADLTVYEFSFVQDELPAGDIDTFRLDVFAAGKAGEDYSDCGSAVIHSPQPGGVYTLALNGEEADAMTLSTTERDVEVFTPVQPMHSDLSLDSLVGPWHLADDTDLETLSEVFPGAAEFGSGMEIRSDGRISWYIGADGAMGSYIIEGNTLSADVTGEMDGTAYRVTLLQPEPEKLTMDFKDVELVWTYGEGDSLRGED